MTFTNKEKDGCPGKEEWLIWTIANKENIGKIKVFLCSL